jgi:hypothetical protein
LALCALAGSASAQHVWLDEKGVKQYSDIPPPPSVPASRILSQPGSRTPASQAEIKTDASIPRGQEMTLAERDADFRKRRAEQAEKEKKAAEEAQLAAEKAKSCERVRNHYQTLSSGQRVVQADQNGKQSFLSDEQRGQELRESRRMLDTCK